MKLAKILGTRNAQELERVIEEGWQTPVIKRLQEPEIALKVMSTGVRSSYLFVKHIIPLYAAHVFQTLSTLAPVDDKLGPILAGITGAVQGELYNNNIYGRPKECHSHYLDMVEAFEYAGGDVSSVCEFEKASNGITEEAQGRKIWTKEPTAYAHHDTIVLLKNPLSTFILVPAIEEMTPRLFESISRNLSPEARFDKYRQFLDRHVEIDRSEHSSVTTDWLEYFLSKKHSSEYEIDESVENVITTMEFRR